MITARLLGGHNRNMVLELREFITVIRMVKSNPKSISIRSTVSEMDTIDTETYKYIDTALDGTRLYLIESEV